MGNTHLMDGRTITERMSVCPRGAPLMSLLTSGIRGEISQLSEAERLVSKQPTGRLRPGGGENLHRLRKKRSM